MPTKICWIHSFENNARIGIMPRPRGGDWLEDEIIYFKRQNVNLLVSLLEAHEITELDLKNEEAFCIQYGITFLHFPIKDRSTPANTNEFIQTILKRINEGANTVIHCRMGIGRSSIMAGAVLISKGYKADGILEHISNVRGLNVPDTEEQAN
ncbi:hypothetical protein [Chitinophaga sp.]|uniref:protein-tyrosine phosphatase family protein n=1 Tax=Chitinophaga sp. TaxID=1869181 RepID=UPI0031DBCC39